MKIFPTAAALKLHLRNTDDVWHQWRQTLSNVSNFYLRLWALQDTRVSR